MAWIAKNSAAPTLQPRRAEPYLSPALKARFEQEYFPRYPVKRGALIQLLHAVQDEVGWLPQQAIEEIAAFIGLTPIEVMDTASFYEEFFFQPRGKYTIWVCQSVSCEIMGSDSILAKLAHKLGIQPGETTRDGRFTLMSVECIGACGAAPCGLCNHTLLENLSPDNLDAVLAKLP